MTTPRLFGESFDPVKFKRAAKDTLDHYAKEAIHDIAENVKTNFWQLDEAPGGKRPADNFALGYKKDTGEVIKNFHDESHARAWLKIMGSEYDILVPRKVVRTESEEIDEAGEYYTEWDDKTNSWLVLHTDKSKAFGSHSTESQAKKAAKKLNMRESVNEAPEGKRPADQWVLAYKKDTGEFVKVFHDESIARKWLAQREGYAILTYDDWVSSQPYVAASGM